MCSQVGRVDAVHRIAAKGQRPQHIGHDVTWGMRAMSTPIAPGFFPRTAAQVQHDMRRHAPIMGANAPFVKTWACGRHGTRGHRLRHNRTTFRPVT